MKKRVEICGINTANLPKLTHEEGIEVLLRARRGDKEAQDLFIMSNLRLVLSVVQRFSGKKEYADDLFQVGCIGLMKAVKNFNIEYNLRFSTYAVPMIIGEIRRFLRDNSAVRVARSLRDTAYKAISARQNLENQMGREITLDKVATAINMDLRDVIYALDAISDPVSLFDPVYHDSGETLMIMDQIGDEKNCDEKWITGVDLVDAVSKLSTREQEIISLRFYQGKTQMEVSEEIGISQAQVSRLEKSAKESLKFIIE